MQRLDARSLVEVGVEPRIDRGERRLDGGDLVEPERPARQRHLDFVHLAEEAHIGLAADTDLAGVDAGLDQLAAALFLQLGQHPVHRGEIHVLDEARQ